MKKIILSIFLLMTTLGFSQNYNGTYKNEWGLTIKISNHSKESNGLTFEIIGNEYPCQGSRKEVAEMFDYGEETKPNVFMFQTGQDIGDEILHLTFNSDGTLSADPGDEGGFYYQGNCAIFNKEIFKKVVSKKAPTKKTSVKKTTSKK
jgi:hypothetical protein